MSAPTLVKSPTMRPISSWADIVEGYRPIAMAKPRWPRARRPKVSLCVSAFQAKRHLRATIDSCLAQHGAELEVVIVDNNNSDDIRDTLAAITDDRVRIIRSETTVPIADNFNLAVEQSNGQFVKLVCPGDLLHPDCVAKQAKVLEDNPDVALVAVRSDYIDDEDKLLASACGLAGLVGRHSAERVIRRMARSSADPIGPPVSGLFRQESFDRCGGCRGDLLTPTDMGLWFRLLGHGDFVGVPQALASSRQGNGSVARLICRERYRTTAQGGNQ
ncbi:glycosyltransferase family 2 protein [Mycobacterium sp. NPDC048908]|uniref:glycosyltransferase family 2 protein n=1 Tax=Mycobacterium sp. NPDC048908 TaxID=3364292 RepID=UPI003712ED21